MTLKALNLFIVADYRTKEHASLCVLFESIKKSLELGGDRKVKNFSSHVQLLSSIDNELGVYDKNFMFYNLIFLS